MSVQSKTEARKEQILKAAERIFARKGYHDSTIAEIAKEAHVSEGSIYEYFDTKEKLLFTIPEAFSNKVHEQNKFHLQLIRGAANRLRATIYLYLHVWQEYPDYAVINLLILKGNENFRRTEGYRFIREGFQGTTQIIKEGIASGEFRSDIDPYVIRSVLMGTVDHVATNWLLSDRKHSLLDLVDPIMDLVMTGLVNDAPQAAGATPRWDHWPARGVRPLDGERAADGGDSKDAKKPGQPE
ncbi:MAG: TetR/AcrR family transcriptional regulator [Desulfarculaceae bacterium]|nr:TetR/AcrR family transcriptional regulator [Desulfarculaceae bacterium]